MRYIQFKALASTKNHEHTNWTVAVEEMSLMETLHVLRRVFKDVPEAKTAEFWFNVLSDIRTHERRDADGKALPIASWHPTYNGEPPIFIYE